MPGRSPRETGPRRTVSRRLQVTAGRSRSRDYDPGMGRGRTGRRPCRPRGLALGACIALALAATFAVQASQAAAAAPEPGTEVAPGVYLESALHLTEAGSTSRPGAAAVSPAARSVVADRIVGGHRTTVRKWPWQVALRYRRPDPYPPLFNCGGSLVAPNV